MDPKLAAFEGRLTAAIDGKTKPIGSLGRIETVAKRVARLQGTIEPVVDTAVLTIFVGDHGMAEAGVSAFPQAVTRQMVLNFLSGGAAANVFAESLGATVQVVDAGVAGDPIDHPKLVQNRIADGTRNAIEEPAMSQGELDAALAAGREIGRALQADVACFGEMGIGNTSSASLVSAKILGHPVADLVGRGTGLNDEGLKQKQALLQTAAGRTPGTLDAQSALSEYGGFEVAMMAGAMMGAAETQRVVIVDGFIATAAALCAREIAPGCDKAFLYAHKSAEGGHSILLESLQAEPLLDLNLRLGEGTGALLAFPLVKAAAAMLRDMASFDSAGVSGPG